MARPARTLRRRLTASAGYLRQVSARSSLLIFSPAATTAAACIRPGDLVRRSIGPDTETAASTRPPGPRTGADTDATPGSRSAAVPAHPAVHPPAFLPGEQDLRARSSRHRQRGADRDGIPQAAGPFGRGDADPR